MGTPMARRVAEAGFAGRGVEPLAGRSRRAGRRHRGTRRCHSGQAATGAAAAITMVTDGDALHALLEGPDGLLAGLAPGAVLVDCSTIGAEAARAAAARVRPTASGSSTRR
jgi:3-hydroxyisobutyrate dehydrogenase-like beta-hydroxyacid dehydrogenase